MSNSKPKANKWQEALDRHQSAATAFAATARIIDEKSWYRPMAAGKWSPAQVTEHLNLTYRIALDQVRGGPGVQENPSGLSQEERANILGTILQKRRLPGGAQAPAEVIPIQVEDGQSDALACFGQLAQEFKEEMESHRGRNDVLITHHFFGALPLLTAIDFFAIHIEHHHRQIAKSGDVHESDIQNNVALPGR
jgi:DinB superfamily